jgi:hypothetical protein
MTERGGQSGLTDVMPDLSGATPRAGADRSSNLVLREPKPTPDPERMLDALRLAAVNAYSPDETGGS